VHMGTEGIMQRIGWTASSLSVLLDFVNHYSLLWPNGRVGGGMRAKTTDAAVSCRCWNSVCMAVAAVAAVATYNLTVVASTSAHSTAFVCFLAITLRDHRSISFSIVGGICVMDPLNPLLLQCQFQSVISKVCFILLNMFTASKV
jgi:hypothetical protein